MARNRSESALRSSVLDRLTGDHGASSRFGTIGLRELKQAVARDLEWLLNTRVWWPGEFRDLEESQKSVLSYGIPDLSVYSWASAGDRERVCAKIEEAVKTFEPRLMARTVKASVAPSEDVADFSVRLRIEAVLHVEPYTEPVSFDTDIYVDTGEVDVRGVT